MQQFAIKKLIKNNEPSTLKLNPLPGRLSGVVEVSFE